MSTPVRPKNWSDHRALTLAAREVVQAEQTSLAKSRAPDSFERVISGFVNEVCNYQTILPMLATNAATGFFRSSLIVRANLAPSGAWGRSWLGKNILSGLGLFAEVGIFTGIAHGLRAAGGEEEKDLAGESLRLALAIGALKLGTLAINRIAKFFRGRGNPFPLFELEYQPILEPKKTAPWVEAVEVNRPQIAMSKAAKDIIGSSAQDKTLDALESKLLAVQNANRLDASLPDHYRVIADYWQAKGDPRGLLIALTQKYEDLLRPHIAFPETEAFGRYREGIEMERQLAFRRALASDRSGVQTLMRSLRTARRKLHKQIEKEFEGLSVGVEFRSHRGFKLSVYVMNTRTETVDRFLRSDAMRLVSELELSSPSIDQNLDVLAERPGLRDFKLFNGIRRTPIRALLTSRLLSRLRGLDLSSCELGDRDLAELLATGSMLNLEWLDLSDNSIDLKGAKRIANSVQLAGLKELDLSDNMIGEKGIEALAGSSTLKGLKWLGLTHTHQGHHGAEAIANSPTLSGLTSLRLDATEGLAMIGARLIANSTHLTGLRSLCLAHCELGHLGLRDLANSENFLGLNDLDLSHEEFNGESWPAQMIADSLAFPVLRSLNLYYNAGRREITRHARILKASPHLPNLARFEQTFDLNSDAPAGANR